jgi:molybdenum cofactor cytidylyltransferase
LSEPEVHIDAPRVAGILLAAGAGSRFGGGKLLHLLDGVAIGVRSARNMLTAGLSVTAVVRSQSDALRRLLEDAGCTVTECETAADGMGVSLAHAIAHTRNAAGWVVALADMPNIRPHTIQQIADAVPSRRICLSRPAYRGTRGHPVGFSAVLRDDLLALKGDEGARSLLKRHHAEIKSIATDDPGVVFDIDRREISSRRYNNAKSAFPCLRVRGVSPAISKESIMRFEGTEKLRRDE